MASKARFPRWVAMSAGTSAAVLSLALSLTVARADDAAPSEAVATGAAAPESAAIAPLDDILPLDRPVVLAAEPRAAPEPRSAATEPAPEAQASAPAAVPADASPDQATIAAAPPAVVPADPVAAPSEIVIAPPDLPPVEVVVDPPRATPPVEQAEVPPAEPVPAPPAIAVAPGAEPAQGGQPPAPVAADVTLPELPPETPLPVIAGEPPADPLLSVAMALKEQLTLPAGAKVGSALVARRDREAIQQFYEARDFRPLFVDAAGVTAAGLGVARQVSTAELDGLDPSSYPVPHLAGTAPAQLADLELGTALAAFAYARDARGGRIEPTRLSNLITPDVELPAPGEVLAALAGTADTAAALEAYQPRHPGYLALKQKLAELRETTGAIGRTPAVGEGPTLRVGMRDARVPALRARLGLPSGPDDTFDSDVSAALAEWQKQQGLRPTGRLDRGMASALDGRSSSGIGAADIVANMERWRWLPQDLGERHIEVNLPEYTLRVFQDGKVIHQTRVVIGKPQTPTPIFSNKMQYVVVNPYWNIPPSIMKKEILPKLAEDPNYAAAHGYEVIRRGNSIAVRQPPGERNALGFIKFLFPNQHSVYLHDTPSRALFAQNKRAFSHGCVRVEQPFRLGEVVLGDEGYDEDRLRKMVGKGERTIRLKEVLPIHLTYFTLFVDETGRLQRRDDLYGYDGRVKTALGISANGLKYANLR